MIKLTSEKKAAELEIVTFERRMWCAFNIILHPQRGLQHCQTYCTLSLFSTFNIDLSASRLSTYKLEFMILNSKVERSYNAVFMQFSIWNRIYNQLIEEKKHKFMAANNEAIATHCETHHVRNHLFYYSTPVLVKRQATK